MSEYDFEDNFDEDQDQESTQLPKPARDRLRELEKELKRLRKERDDSAKALTELRLRDVLTERGITDQRITRYLTADGVNLADPRAVDDWLAENGDLFGYTPRAGESDEKDEAEQRTMDDAENQGVPVTDQAELLAKIAAAETPEELDALRAKHSDLRMT